jgi:hypothetical protein
MLVPFFDLAARSPSRQGTFRRAVVAHLLLVAFAGFVVAREGHGQSHALLGHLLLVAGVVEGALLVGWRLTQLPRSQALEFLLVSPIRPARLLRAEAAVGLTLFGLVTLSGLPILALLAGVGLLDPLDLVPLLLMPWTWGAITGVGLAVWAYEPRTFRKVGEIILLLGILFYLVVGILAGEKLREWLTSFPEATQVLFLRTFVGMHTHNPFGMLRQWMEADLGDIWQEALALEGLALAVLVLLVWRASRRLEGHFHERHYEPARDVSATRRPPVGDRPLAWWAVKRVSEYSGRINLYLAGGFCLLYAGYIIAEPHWPAWMGRRIFEMCDSAGGAAMLASALVVLAAVPAAFQYGLWDSSAQDRCRRLELLLLTRLGPRDYWEAAAAAAWRRGRGYFFVAVGLWLAAWVGGRLSGPTALVAVCSGGLLWGLYFALGFRAFSRGSRANGLGMLLTIGLPAFAVALARGGLSLFGDWLPPGMVYRAATGPLSAWALGGPLAIAALTLVVSRRSLAQCDERLRHWYDGHHGNKVMS